MQVNARASAACRRAARHQRKRAAAAAVQLKRCAAERQAERERDAAVRGLFKLAQALRELARLDAARAARAGTGVRAAAEEAVRLDARRRDLARRIANLAHDADTPSPAPAGHSGQVPHAFTPARIRLVSD